jgi:hypothetical protein
MSLRIAERHPRWLQRIAAWSAASLWWFRSGEIRSLGIAATADRSREGETPERRLAYFESVFTSRTPVLWPTLSAGHTQPEQWYRNPSGEWAQAHIRGARRDRQEYYSEHFRKLHWRIAHEQLAFCHIPFNPDGSPPPADAPYRGIRVPTLLLAGQLDNFEYTWICDRTRVLGSVLEVPGRCMLLRNTGHSIQNERPHLLAELLYQHIYHQRPPPD